MDIGLCDHCGQPAVFMGYTAHGRVKVCNEHHTKEVNDAVDAPMRARYEAALEERRLQPFAEQVTRDWGLAFIYRALYQRRSA